MSRAQGHIANVLWVLFDHVIESQRQNRLSQDTEMATGKFISQETSTLLWNFVKLGRLIDTIISNEKLSNNSFGAPDLIRLDLKTFQ